MRIEVRYYAAARELAGTDHENCTLHAGDGQHVTGAQLLETLGAQHPALARHVTRMRLAVNETLCGIDIELHDGDRVDILPPVAGGSGTPDHATPRHALCAIRSERLAVDDVISAIQHAGAGGLTLFLGVVRDNADGKDVARLDYESHPTLAEREMRAVLSEVEAAHAGTRLAALHRIGQLAVGDIAVIVGASAAHRGDAFTACRAAIDLIKARVPIWKKEWDTEGAPAWVNLG